MTQDNDTTQPHASRPQPVPGEPPQGSPAPRAVDAEEPAADAAAPEATAEDALAGVERERDQYLDALQRMKAEFENYRKRTDRDRLAQRDAAAREVVLDVVPVLDNLERAVEALGQADATLADGVEMVRQQLSAVLNGRGLQEIEVLGQAFDPTLHDAVSMAPSPEPEGTIVAVVQKGYRMGDAVVRAAKVVVSAGQ
ncbi:MAG: nucleotide exchange factor GrpE [Thermoleophilia bacterium]|nr:nucleotide exchange factor GrpE [Thermoleophilia bacterium]